MAGYYAEQTKSPVNIYIYIYTYIHTYIHTHTHTGVGSGGGGTRGHVPPTFLIGGQWYVCAPFPLLTPHFHFPLELYVAYITLTNNYLAFFIKQLITLYLVDNFNKLTQMAASK